MNANIEEGSQIHIDFEKIQKIGSLDLKVIPVVVQNCITKEVVMLAYASKESHDYTIKYGFAAFWSTSKNKLHIKGETSGDKLKLIETRVNCEQNSLLYLVKLVGVGGCHTKDGSGIHRSSCYYRQIKTKKLVFLD